MASEDDFDEFRHINIGSKEERRRTRIFMDEDEHEPIIETGWGPHPVQRSECPEYRPCPFIGCKYHYGIDSGVINEKQVVRVAIGFLRIIDNCALDFVEDHPDGATLEEVGEALLLTRERVRQIELNARKKLGLDPEYSGDFDE